MRLRSWRWWQWCLATLVLLALAAVTLAVSLRSWSLGRLDRVEQRLRDEGRPTRYAEILATVSFPDAARHASWSAIEARWEKTSSDGTPAAQRWLTAGAPSPTPEPVAAWLAAEADLIDQTVADLDRAPLILGSLPDPALFAGGRNPGIVGLGTMRMVNIVALRHIALALATRALAQRDDAALAALERLSGSLAPQTLFDALVLRAIVSLRDQACLLAILRRCEGAAVSGWIASAPLVLASSRQAMLGERLRFSGPFADSTREGAVLDGYWWAMGPADAAVLVESQAAMETRLAGTPCADPPVPRWAMLSRVSLSNTSECGQAVVEADAQERAARVAGLLLLAWRDGEAPPATGAGLGHSSIAMLAARPGAAVLRYTRTSDGFVIDIDPLSPRPPAMIRAAKALSAAKPLSLGAGVAVQEQPAP